MGIDVQAEPEGFDERVFDDIMERARDEYPPSEGFEWMDAYFTEAARHGYLRESYHGGPYSTDVLLPEAAHPGGWRGQIPAHVLQERLPRAIEIARAQGQSQVLDPAGLEPPADVFPLGTVVNTAREAWNDNRLAGEQQALRLQRFVDYCRQLEAAGIILVHAEPAPPKAMKWLAGAVAHFNLTLVVIDTFYHVTRVKDLNDYAAVGAGLAPIHDTARASGNAAHIMLTHHASKNGG
jgi:hypothetical protein